MIPVLKKEIPLKMHAHQANDILTAIRLAKEFDVNLTLEHVTEGHLIADKLAETDYMMAVGPSLTHASKFELQNKSWTTPGILAAKGCHVSIITDAPVIPQQYLPLCASLAVKAGMDEFEALKVITINPAEHIGVADRVGSLEVGKDADIVVYEGSPLENSSTIRLVLIDGNIIN
jgi:imidazolonepropionase-like amidohydrolase